MLVWSWNNREGKHWPLACCRISLCPANIVSDISPPCAARDHARPRGCTEDRGQLICGLKCGDGWRLSIIWQPGPRSPQPPSCTYSASGDLGFSILYYLVLVLHAKSIPVTFEYCLLPTLIWLEALLTAPTALPIQASPHCRHLCLTHYWHPVALLAVATFGCNISVIKQYNLIKLMRSLSFHGLKIHETMSLLANVFHISTRKRQRKTIRKDFVECTIQCCFWGFINNV